MAALSAYRVDGKDHHICCAIRPELSKLKLEFDIGPPKNGGKDPRTICVKCNEDVKKFVKQDSSGSVYYHPCCACRQHDPNLCKCRLSTPTKNAMTDSMLRQKSPWKSKRARLFLGTNLDNCV
jgi:hypothetical protein